MYVSSMISFILDLHSDLKLFLLNSLETLEEPSSLLIFVLCPLLLVSEPFSLLISGPFGFFLPLLQLFLAQILFLLFLIFGGLLKNTVLLLFLFLFDCPFGSSLFFELLMMILKCLLVLLDIN